MSSTEFSSLTPAVQQRMLSRFDLSREVEKGLTFRPLAVTAADTLEFHHSRPWELQARVIPRFLSEQEERDLLAAWHAR